MAAAGCGAAAQEGKKKDLAGEMQHSGTQRSVCARIEFDGGKHEQTDWQTKREFCIAPVPGSDICRFTFRGGLEENTNRTRNLVC